MALFRLKVVFQLGVSLLIISVLLAIVSCKNNKPDTLPFYNSADFTAEWITENDMKYKAIHTIEVFSMQNQLGQIFTSDSLKGKIYIANFFFTICPSICPKMTNNLSVLQEKFKQEKDFKLIFFSVTPWIDSVATLKKYALKHKINSEQWHLLTGQKETIYQLGRQSFFAEKSIG